MEARRRRRRRRRKIVLGLVARSLLSIALPPVGLDRVHRSGGLPEFGEQIHKSKQEHDGIRMAAAKRYSTVCADAIAVSILPSLSMFVMVQKPLNSYSRLDCKMCQFVLL